MDLEQFEERKRDHIRHALSPENQASGLAGLARIRLHHEPLPEIDFDQVSLNSTCLGQPSQTPFFISGMTAGHADAPALNRLLARACARRGWAMGVGSQRRELDAALQSGGASGAGNIDQWMRLREEVPGLVLFANLGASQIREASVPAIRRLLDGIRAQALAIHLNPLQECMQPEGTPKFAGVLDGLRTLVRELGAPVVLKETGCGFSPRSLERIKDLGLAAVDVSGLGGTHWGRIEGARARGADPIRAGAAETFAGWGEPTADSVVAARRTLPRATEIWASGGVRSGLDAAKLIALGATQVGYAKPALEAALEGEVMLDRWMQRQEFELRTALFCTGSRSPADLREKEGSWTTSAN